MTNNRSYSAATLPGSTALPFVIWTEAQRSGEICGFSGPFLEMFFLQSKGGVPKIAESLFGGGVVLYLSR